MAQPRRETILQALRRNSRRTSRLTAELADLMTTRAGLVHEARDEGASLGEVADALGVTRQAVADFLARRARA